MELDKTKRETLGRRHFIDIDIDECTPSKLKLEVFHYSNTKDNLPVEPLSTWMKKKLNI